LSCYAPLGTLSNLSNHKVMQPHLSSQPSGKSNIVAAVIIATGLIVSAVIITKPNFSLALPPISTGSVESQFTQQVKSQTAGKQFDHMGVKTTLQDFKVEKVRYLPEKKSYIIEYSINWGSGWSSYIGCPLRDNGDGKFSGNCTAAVGSPPRQISILVK
jgi:hypothetical protein